jgi:CheY-like chemotaxis protein
LKVLIVDDEPEIRHVARLSLGKLGRMNVIEASSGAEAIATARKERPDLVLLDVMMPGMDGCETFRALRADPDTAAIPVIFLTAAGRTSEVSLMMDEGAKGVLYKPFDPVTLASEVRAILHE